jgi:16S rRNA processing protein RimM
VPARDGQWLVAGRVGRPHGLDGSFHVLQARGALPGAGGTVRVGSTVTEVARRAGTSDRPIVRLAGFEDRDAAAALGGTALEVARADAPALGEDEWYAEDLAGCRVVDGGHELGRVRRLVALPSCEALEVLIGGDVVLVPLVRDAVRSVDVEARVIDVDVAFLGETAPSRTGAPEAGSPAA